MQALLRWKRATGVALRTTVGAGSILLLAGGGTGDIPKYLGQFAFCNQYARSAIDQVKRAAASACGFSGPGWTSNFRAHENWCRSLSSKDAAIGEQNARNQQLAKCIAQKETPQDCGKGWYRAADGQCYPKLN
jgi:hypothetical protein